MISRLRRSLCRAFLIVLTMPIWLFLAWYDFENHEQGTSMSGKFIARTIEAGEVGVGEWWKEVNRKVVWSLKWLNLY